MPGCYIESSQLAVELPRCDPSITIHREVINMSETVQNKAPEQMVEAIFALDLAPIKMKLMDKKEGHGWDQAKADRLEIEYKRYLVLLAKFPDEVIAPTTDVDKFWHGHILDTMKYARDCENVFGYFLHHYPYFGLRGEQDAANLQAAAERMRRLYQQEFGAGAAGAAGYCCKADEPRAAQAGEDVSYCCKTAVSYCCKADEAMAAQGVESAYCCRAEESAMAQGSEESAYCCKTAVSYCCKANEQLSAEAGQDSAYCCKAAVSYCCKASDQVAAPAEDAGLDVSYCCKAADKLQAEAAAATA
jgi:hypothetical protein